MDIDLIKEAFVRVNNRLPQALVISNPTGHTGRHSFVSAGINANVLAEVVAKASKHRCSSALKRYNHPNESQKIAPGRTRLARYNSFAKPYGIA